MSRSRSLSNREKNLLLLCVGVLAFVALAILTNIFLGRRQTALQQIATLQNEKRDNDSMLRDQEFWDKRHTWLAEKMPKTDSLGRAQGQLLEDLQNEALDLGIVIQQQTLPEALTTTNFREVTVNLRVRGDQTVMLQWLAGMQSPERFQAIKEFKLELDNRAKEKTPQAICNLTVARWFKPETGI
jgi:hypothetical protein